MKFEYFQYPYNSDNYGVLIHNAETGETASVDAGDCDATLNALAQKGWALTEVWITHHHWDHTDGLLQLKAATGCRVVGPVEKSKHIAGLDEKLSDGDSFLFGGERVQILSTPGHTLDMINFYLPGEGVLFTGDTLFVMGCGWLFEGTPKQMFQSLNKLAALPHETLVYCAHEYSMASAKFALTVDPSEPNVAARAEAIEALRKQDKPTVPTTIGEELATNPFLRAHSSGIRSQLGLIGATDLEVFTELRELKNKA